MTAIALNVRTDFGIRVVIKAAMILTVSNATRTVAPVWTVCQDTGDPVVKRTAVCCTVKTKSATSTQENAASVM